ncbi:hypothetical protein COCOBI_15-1780 [Coccomyxa sp. Obi]|nr:hypothetical protein COCOBI_15-1780 [Coccomyxa sp. Obi]
MLPVSTHEEELYKLGDDIWVHEKYLAYLKKPKDLDIILYQTGQPGDKDHRWMAQAPEWPNAFGFGSSKEEASEYLQSGLVAAKLMFIEDKDVDGIEQIPVRPCKKNAEKARRNRWHASRYDRLEKESTDWVWSKIRV